jgi:hypothetical protein
MCRNIRTLPNFWPPATAQEVHAAATKARDRAEARYA